MESKNSHSQTVDKQFGSQAQDYLTSTIHSQGPDLQRLVQLLQSHPDARVIDLGCGAGHASFVAAKAVKEVVAYDLSAQMLEVVSQAAKDKGLANISVERGVAESLPFADGSADIIISRYSAHHWHDVGQALREVRRVLKPGGIMIMMDLASTGQPVKDIFLQTIEKLRDTSHVHNYAPGEWLTLFSEAGLLVQELTSGRSQLEFKSWVERMRTPEHFVVAIRELQKAMSDEVIQHFEIQEDGTFTVDLAFIIAKKS